MKFPVVFRIYAVLNLLFFFAFGFVTVVITIEPSSLGLFIVALHWILIGWLLAAALAWFFANDAAYHFLYSLSAILLMVCGTWIWYIWLSGNVQNGDDRLFGSIPPAVLFFYSIFLLAASFYKPVIHWTAKRFSLKHCFITLGYASSIFAGIILVSRMYQGIAELPVSYVVWGTDSANEIPQVIQGDGWVRYELSNPTMVNGLVMDISAPPANTKLFTTAKLSYSEIEDFDPKTAPSIEIHFRKSGSQLQATFVPIKARTFQLSPLSNSKDAQPPTETFAVATLKPVWFYTLFEKNRPEVFYENNAQAPLADYSYDDTTDGEVYEEGEEESEEQEVGNGRSFSRMDIPELYAQDLNSDYFGETNEWTFDYSTGSIDVNGAKLGMYRQGTYGIYSFLGTVARDFKGFSAYDYDRYLTDLSGIALYNDRAKSYDFEGNGTAFNSVNPAIIEWAHKNLIPNPQTEIAGVSAQTYYDKLMKRYCRMMVLSHIYLQKKGYDEEVAIYRSASFRDEFYGPLYLRDRYEGIPMFDGTFTEDGWYENYEFLGFWLRRRIDTTDTECWKALTKLMIAYDKEWYDTADVSLAD